MAEFEVVSKLRLPKFVPQSCIGRFARIADAVLRVDKEHAIAVTTKDRKDGANVIRKVRSIVETEGKDFHWTREEDCSVYYLWSEAKKK